MRDAQSPLPLISAPTLPRAHVRPPCPGAECALHRQDDQEIYWEGVNSLSFEELQAAVCASTQWSSTRFMAGLTSCGTDARAPMHLRLSTRARMPTDRKTHAHARSRNHTRTDCRAASSAVPLALLWAQVRARGMRGSVRPRRPAAARRSPESGRAFSLGGGLIQSACLFLCVCVSVWLVGVLLERAGAGQQARGDARRRAQAHRRDRRRASSDPARAGLSMAGRAFASDRPSPCRSTRAAGGCRLAGARVGAARVAEGLGRPLARQEGDPA